jgi:hypothetical protein
MLHVSPILGHLSRLDAFEMVEVRSPLISGCFGLSDLQSPNTIGVRKRKCLERDTLPDIVIDSFISFLRSLCVYIVGTVLTLFIY